jgi:hypothetical protein
MSFPSFLVTYINPPVFSCDIHPRISVRRILELLPLQTLKPLQHIRKNANSSEGHMYILLRFWCILLGTVQQCILIIEISLAEEQAGSKFNDLADESGRGTYSKRAMIVHFRLSASGNTSDRDP